MIMKVIVVTMKIVVVKQVMICVEVQDSMDYT